MDRLIWFFPLNPNNNPQGGINKCQGSFQTQQTIKSIPEIQQTAYAQALSDLLNALRADITTVVDIALNTGEEIFHDSKTKQALMKSIYNTVLENLKN